MDRQLLRDAAKLLLGVGYGFRMATLSPTTALGLGRGLERTAAERCGTCKWWGQPVMDTIPQESTCNRGEAEGRKFDIWAKDGGTPTALITDADFGCVQWEGRG